MFLYLSKIEDLPPKQVAVQVRKANILVINMRKMNMSLYLSWREGSPPKRNVGGSIPPRDVI